MNVLVTGANGFLGSRIVAQLCAAGHHVRAMMRRGSAERPASVGAGTVETVLVDLLSDTDLRPSLAGIDVVIHLAAAMGGSAAEQLAVAVGATERLLGAIDGSRTRFILASSFAVYDWSRIGASVTEDSPLLADEALDGQDAYTLAKTRQERMARRVCAERGIGLTVMRPAMVWGAGGDAASCVGPNAGPFILVLGPERGLRLTHVDNCASAFVAALDPRATGATFNVDDGYRLTAWQFAPAVSRRRRLPLPLAWFGALATTVALVLAPLRRGRPLPGLLQRARRAARFHPALAGHAALASTLGWSPPQTLPACLQRSGIR